MTCNRWDAIRINLASDEASPEERAAFEDHAADCVACAADLAAMRSATRVVVLAAGSRAEAAAATADLTLTLPPQRQPLGAWGMAALLTLTFTIGYGVRWIGEARAPSPEATTSGQTARDVTLAGEYARLHATSPGLSTIGKGMLGLARR